jgi:hypothetical protein
MRDIITHNTPLYKDKVFTKSCNSASQLQFNFLLGNTLPCLKNGTFEKLKLGNSMPWWLPWRGLGGFLGVTLAASLARPWWLPWRGLGGFLGDALVASLAMPWWLPWRCLGGFLGGFLGVALVASLAMPWWLPWR